MVLLLRLSSGRCSFRSASDLPDTPMTVCSQERRCGPHYASGKWFRYSDSSLDVTTGYSNETGPWHFKGKRIAAAMVQDLLDTQLLASAEVVLMTGDSAGGVGVLNNADFVFSMIRCRACFSIFCQTAIHLARDTSP